MAGEGDKRAELAADCAAVGVDLAATLRVLYILRAAQFVVCLAAAVLGFDSDGASVPSIALDMVAAVLTLVKVAFLYFRPDGTLRGRLAFILDLVNACVLLSAGATQAAYVRGLPPPAPTGQTASYILSFVGAALFFPSARRLRRVHMSLNDEGRQRLVPGN
jgi:hypothetical protein